MNNKLSHTIYGDPLTDSVIVNDVASVFIEPKFVEWTSPSVIVLVNGPRESGKDTTAKLIQERLAEAGFSSEQEKFAYCLKRGIAASWSLTDDEYDYYFETDAKKIPCAKFLGRKPYEVLIDYSEKFLKPIFGEWICAELFLQRTAAVKADAIIISDSGFNCEVKHLINRVHPSRITLFRLHRGTRTFEGDSREWVYGNDAKLYTDRDVIMPEAYMEPQEYDEEINAMVDDVKAAINYARSLAPINNSFE